MPPPTSLAATFLAHAKVRAAPVETEALEQSLRAGYETSSAAFPGVALPPERYVRYLAERLPQDGAGAPPEQLLQRMHLPHLYLACACVDEVPGAVEAFERQLMEKLPGLLASLSREAIQDTCQKVRELVLLRPAGGSPGISAYSGRGSLMSWLRVAAARVAARQGGRKSADPLDSSIMERMPAAAADPELDLIRRDAGEAFKACLRDAIATLSGEEGLLLRLHYHEGLSTVAMAKLHGVSQPTISRRLQGARQKVLEATRHGLKERLNLSGQDLESYLAALDSRLDLSMSQLFEAE